MNKQIKKYWEDKGHKIIYSSTSDCNIGGHGPFYYFHMNGIGPKHYVAMIRHGEFVYFKYPHWVSEEEMLEFIQNKTGNNAI